MRNYEVATLSMSLEVIVMKDSKQISRITNGHVCSNIKKPIQENFYGKQNLKMVRFLNKTMQKTKCDILIPLLSFIYLKGCK